MHGVDADIIPPCTLIDPDGNVFILLFTNP